MAYFHPALRAIVLASSAVFLSASVTSGPGPADSRQIRNAGEVRMVRNPLKPRDGVVAPKFALLWSVGGEGDPRGDLINRPLEVRFGPDGSVYVLDWGDTCVRVFDASGRFVRQVGRKGQGPGEFDTPCWFDVDRQGRVHLLDGRALRITRFDPDGRYEASFRIEKFASQIRVDPEGRIYVGESSVGEPVLTSEFRKVQRTLTIIRYDADGGNPVRLGSFQGETMIMKAVEGGAMMASSPSAPQTGWGLDPSGRLWAGYNGTYELGVYDSDGRSLFRFGREFRPDRNKAFDRVDSAARKMTVLNEDFPAFAQDFLFDESGNVWLRMFRNEEPKDEPFRYDVFSPEGVYLRQVAAPFRIYGVRDGKAVAVVDTEEEFKALKVFRF